MIPRLGLDVRTLILGIKFLQSLFWEKSHSIVLFFSNFPIMPMFGIWKFNIESPYMLYVVNEQVQSVAKISGC